MTNLGYTDADGIVWHSPNNEVIISSKFIFREEDSPYWRIIVNDEKEGKNQLVLRAHNDEEWQQRIHEAKIWAEGYYQGKYDPNT